MVCISLLSSYATFIKPLKVLKLCILVSFWGSGVWGNEVCLAGEVWGWSELMHVLVPGPVPGSWLPTVSACCYQHQIADWLVGWRRGREAIFWFQDQENWWYRKRQVAWENWFEEVLFYSLLALSGLRPWQHIQGEMCWIPGINYAWATLDWTRIISFGTDYGFSNVSGFIFQYLGGSDKADVLPWHQFGLASDFAVGDLGRTGSAPGEGREGFSPHSFSSFHILLWF